MKITVLLSHDLHVRNFVASGCIKELAKRGHHLSLVVPQRLIEPVSNMTSEQGIVARLESLDAMQGGRWLSRFRRNYRLASFVHRRNSPTYQNKLTMGIIDPDSFRYPARIRALHFLDHLFNLEIAGQVIEHLIPPHRAATELISNLNPETLIYPTLIHTDNEVEVIKAAKKARVPVVAFPASWDTLTAKGAFIVRPDYLLLWGQENYDHAIKLHGFDADKVFVTGTPHFDVYGPEFMGEERSRFLTKRGIDPGQHVLLFAGSSQYYMADEALHVKALSEAIVKKRLKNCVIWYRPHPRRDSDYSKQCQDLPGIYVDEQRVRDGKTWAADSNGLRHYRSLLDACDGVLTRFSTLIVEAALLGKPSLALEFALNEEAQIRLRHHFAYEHAQGLLALPGVQTCRSFQEVLEGIEGIIAGNFAWVADDLRGKASTIAHNLDGRAIERIIQAIEALAQGKSPAFVTPTPKLTVDATVDGLTRTV